MQKSMSKIKIVAVFLLIALAIGFTIYNFYPKINQTVQKDKIIAVAKENHTEIADRIDFNALLALNPDTIGWVQIEGTPLEYPVVQTDNNDYYLSHNYLQEESFEGAVFRDYLCNTTTTRNHVLYGHYMSDESMFGSLWNYQDQAYLKLHPVIQFDQPGHPGDWEIFSIYITKADYDYRQPEFITDGEFIDYMNRLKARSLYDTGVTLDPDDEVLTLSTCIYTFDDARFAVHARKVK
ncbi:MULTISPECIES: class B sortase [unclassified Acetobacterium]|uniref:class B sortase n=1 Tax=unclassified Acetobacterium TaxID=2638182 RepID=UPI000DBEC1BA|nr:MULTISPECIES: class B sortase [unclassified Acetobacterium]AWW25623.1 SrtB family sortase [Acetobacterium sp. KB-1]MDZ5724570.1 class B sortase [Acetobacterium sp. K1/6]